MPSLPPGAPSQAPAAAGSAMASALASDDAADLAAPASAASTSSSATTHDRIAAWHGSVQHLRGLLEEARLAERHGALRGALGGAAWERAAEQAASMRASVEASVEAAQVQVARVNLNRKRRAEGVAGSLKRLARQWGEGMGASGRLELEVAAAEREAKRLRTIAVENGLVTADET